MFIQLLEGFGANLFSHRDFLRPVVQYIPQHELGLIGVKVLARDLLRLGHALLEQEPKSIY